MDKTITLQASNGDLFEIDKAIARELGTLNNFIDVGDVDGNIIVPLPNVSSAPLPKIINFCKNNIQFRAKNSDPPVGSTNHSTVDEMEAFNQEFVKGESTEDLLELAVAANYLNAKDLLNLLNQTVADRIQNKSVEYVRKIFGIESDYTPEEEARLRQEYGWAFEGVDED